MKKPLINFEEQQGSCETILRQTLTKKQLVKQIHCYSLTDCLTILKNSGYTGDTAIFILANFQTLEVEA
ncbi:hypothetical protein [Nostoc sp. PA-18-2419]|uniref:hypothetical protein n=1 Tax=Nostoc sp. PA-18-2419 TaxID=2575443 RepID=UPI0011096D49|nr:hypothetical protein [Nostoc sp. PA-18-2419]